MKTLRKFDSFEELKSYGHKEKPASISLEKQEALKAFLMKLQAKNNNKSNLYLSK